MTHEIAIEACSASREHSAGRGRHDARKYGPCGDHDRITAEVMTVLNANSMGQVALLRDLARRCHNGAPDPYQEFYDLGLSPLLDRLADALERVYSPGQATP